MPTRKPATKKRATAATRGRKTRAASAEIDESPRYTTRIVRALVGTDPDEPGITPGERLARKIEAGMHEPYIFLRVSGNGLKSSSIIDGDLVLVNTKAAPENGDIAAIVYDRQYRQVGRYHREKTGRIRITLDRDQYPRPFYYAPDRVLVEGVVEGIYRQYSPPASDVVDVTIDAPPKPQPKVRKVGPAERKRVERKLKRMGLK